MQNSPSSFQYVIFAAVGLFFLLIFFMGIVSSFSTHKTPDVLGVSNIPKGIVQLVPLESISPSSSY